MYKRQEDLLYLFLVIVVSGADKFIIRGIHHIPDILNLSGYLVYKFLAGHACLLCLHLDLDVYKRQGLR